MDEKRVPINRPLTGRRSAVIAQSRRRPECVVDLRAPPVAPLAGRVVVLTAEDTMTAIRVNALAVALADSRDVFQLSYDRWEEQNDPDHADSLALAIASLRPEVVLFCGNSETARVAVLAARIAKVSTAWMVVFDSEAMLSLTAWPDLVVAEGDEQVRRLVSAGCPPDRVIRIPYAALITWPRYAGALLGRAFDALAESARKRPPARAAVSSRSVGWPEPPATSGLRAMAVLDRELVDELDGSLDLILPKPDTWRALLDRDSPAMLLLSPAISGNEGSWSGRYISLDGPCAPLREMIDACRRRGLPIVFYATGTVANTSDKLAVMCDHVFTDNAARLERYRLLGCASVHLLPIALRLDAECLQSEVGSLARPRVLVVGSVDGMSALTKDSAGVKNVLATMARAVPVITHTGSEVSKLLAPGAVLTVSQDSDLSLEAQRLSEDHLTWALHASAARRHVLTSHSIRSRVAVIVSIVLETAIADQHAAVETLNPAILRHDPAVLRPLDDFVTHIVLERTAIGCTKQDATDLVQILEYTARRLITVTATGDLPLALALRRTDWERATVFSDNDMSLDWETTVRRIGEVFSTSTISVALPSLEQKLST